MRTRPPSAPVARWRWVLLAVLVVAGVVVALSVDLPSVSQLRRSVGSYGSLAPLVFVAVYAVITLAPVPKNVLSAVAGLVFGLAAGVALVWVAALVGALLGFGLGRLLGRDAVERLTSSRLAQVEQLLDRRGVQSVVVARLIPVVPFTALNYAAGLTGIRMRSYVTGTAVGIVPGTVAYVALGTYGRSPGSWPFILSVAALLLLSVGGVVAARTRRAGRRVEGR